MLRAFRKTNSTTAAILIQRRIQPQQQPQQQRRCRNSNVSTTFFEPDTGALGTKIHHHMTTSLALLTPIYFLTPDSMTDGIISRGFGLLLSINASVHSWIGLNYVARDYVPKISATLLGPARIVILGLSAVTMIGMSKISLSSPGGLKAVVKGAWNPQSNNNNNADEPHE